MTCRKRSNDPVLQGTDQVQQDDHNDRNARQPEDDVAEHGRNLLQATGTRRRTPNSKRAGTDLSR
jgi:hypothetical protein